jgi:hypothetical protein
VAETDSTLEVAEAAILEGISQDAIRARIRRNQIKAYRVAVSGRQGFEYRVPLTSLTPSAQRKYAARFKRELAEQAQISIDDLSLGPKDYKGLTMLDLTAEQRDEAYAWKAILDDWQRFIAGHHKRTTEKTGEFVRQHNADHPNQPISERNLRKKWALFRDYGSVALADERHFGGHKGTRIPEKLYSAFMLLWLDENKPCATTIYALVSEWAKTNVPELLPLPHVESFRRAIAKLPKAVTTYYRDGDKAFADECLPFVKRVYDGISPNDVWSADYHTLDFFVKDDVTGEVFRPHMIIWFDVRSRKVLSAYLTRSANSDGAIIAFRRAVTKYGIPGAVYLDNGREFLVSDFGGRGNRKTDTTAVYGSTILARLGVKLHLAKVKNARAKIIERVFRNVTFDYSRLVNTYCGGKPDERPERLNGILEDENKIPLLSETRERVQLFFDGWHNERPSQAEGLDGTSPNRFYAENLTYVRRAATDELNLMLLRSARSQKVKRNGVSIKIGESELWFYSDDLAKDHLGEDVFVRYDPERLETVWILNANERFIAHAELTKQGGYDFEGGADAEAIKDAARRKKRLKGSVVSFADALKNETGGDINAINQLVAAARRRAANAPQPNPKLIELARPVPQAEYAAAVGDEPAIDYGRMARNALARKERENETKSD